jgi:hypothetical protein
MHEDEIGTVVVDCAVRLHRELGPGLLEAVMSSHSRADCCSAGSASSDRSGYRFTSTACGSNRDFARIYWSKGV